jgi:hypothetical protein
LNPHRDLIDHGLGGPVDDTAHDEVLAAALREMSETRRRHRTRRWHLAAALTALLGVVVTATSRPTPIDLAATPLPAEPALADVWPDAVHVLPTHLADGRRWVPQMMVDRDSVIATDDPDHPRALLLVDLRRGQARKVADLPHPPESAPVRFAAGSRHLVWLNDGARDQIWRVPLKGGRPHLVATLPPDLSRAPSGPVNPWLADRLVVDDDMVYVSTVHTAKDSQRPGASSGTRNLLRVPLEGGTPEPVPGSEGRQVVVWPWLGKLPSANCDATIMIGCVEVWDTPPPPFTANNSVFYADLRNLITEERRTAAVSPPGFLALAACGVSRCVSGTGNGTWVSNRDGSDGRTLPGRLSSWIGPLTLDRFVFLKEPSRLVMLHDLKTGRKVPVGLNDLEAADSLKNTGAEYFVDSPDDRLVLWRSGGAYVIVDLGAIP